MFLIKMSYSSKKKNNNSKAENVKVQIVIYCYSSKETLMSLTYLSTRNVPYFLDYKLLHFSHALSTVMQLICKFLLVGFKKI